MVDCRKVVMLGATRGMGRSLARLMAEDGRSLFLLGRDREQLAASAADLEIRGEQAASDLGVSVGVGVGFAAVDLADFDSFAPGLKHAEEQLGGFDAVVVTAASFATQDDLEAEPARATELVRVNLANTIGFCELARERLLAAGGGVLCVFSSVAGDRGRRSVAIYGASKAGLSHYLESLDHGYRKHGLRVVCVKPGFVETSMTAGLEAPPFSGSPDEVAKTVLRAIDRGRPVVYAPPIWRLVMIAVRYLPRWLMRRLDF